jgi:hypothetical protein
MCSVGLIMTVASLDVIMSHCGLCEAELDSEGLPELSADEEFKKTFESVSLIAGGEHDLGSGLLHFTNRCGSGR